jgi:hypothetical protein
MGMSTGITKNAGTAVIGSGYAVRIHLSMLSALRVIHMAWYE